MTSADVHIVALGARTPVGLRAESAAAAVRAGISRLAECPFLVGASSELLIGARDPRLDVLVPLTERLVTMAVSALEEVVRKLSVGPARLPRLHIYYALPEPRFGFAEGLVASVADGLAEQTAHWGLPLQWLQVGRGHAGGCLGMQQALKHLAQNKSDLCIVGGLDSYMDATLLNALYEERRLQTADARSGFAPGEGAAFFALAGENVQRGLQLPSLGVVRGAQTSQETKLVSDGAVSRADGLVQAVLGACASLQLPQQAPTMVLCDINGERHRSEEWGLLQLRIGDRMRTTAYASAVSYWGDQGAATFPLLAMLACCSWSRGYALDERALLWSASDSGLRGAAVIEQPR